MNTTTASIINECLASGMTKTAWCRANGIFLSKSFSAKVTSEVLELFFMYMEKNSEKLIEDAHRKGEKPSPQPKVPKIRFEDQTNGRVFYVNEKSKSGITVFYLHGGVF